MSIPELKSCQADTTLTFSLIPKTKIDNPQLKKLQAISTIIAKNYTLKKPLAIPKLVASCKLSPHQWLVHFKGIGLILDRQLTDIGLHLLNQWGQEKGNSRECFQLLYYLKTYSSIPEKELVAHFLKLYSVFSDKNFSKETLEFLCGNLMAFLEMDLESQFKNELNPLFDKYKIHKKCATDCVKTQFLCAQYFFEKANPAASQQALLEILKHNLSSKEKKKAADLLYILFHGRTSALRGFLSLLSAIPSAKPVCEAYALRLKNDLNHQISISSSKKGTKKSTRDSPLSKLNDRNLAISRNENLPKLLLLLEKILTEDQLIWKKILEELEHLKDLQVKVLNLLEKKKSLETIFAKGSSLIHLQLVITLAIRHNRAELLAQLLSQFYYNFLVSSNATFTVVSETLVSSFKVFAENKFHYENLSSNRVEELFYYMEFYHAQAWKMSGLPIISQFVEFSLKAKSIANYSLSTYLLYNALLSLKQSYCSETKRLIEVLLPAIQRCPMETSKTFSMLEKDLFGSRLQLLGTALEQSSTEIPAATFMDLLAAHVHVQNDSQEIRILFRPFLVFKGGDYLLHSIRSAKNSFLDYACTTKKIIQALLDSNDTIFFDKAFESLSHEKVHFFLSNKELKTLKQTYFLNYFTHLLPKFPFEKNKLECSKILDKFKAYISQIELDFTHPLTKQLYKKALKILYSCLTKPENCDEFFKQFYGELFKSLKGISTSQQKAALAGCDSSCMQILQQLEFSLLRQFYYGQQLMRMNDFLNDFRGVPSLDACDQSHFKRACLDFVFSIIPADPDLGDFHVKEGLALLENAQSWGLFGKEDLHMEMLTAFLKPSLYKKLSQRVMASFIQHISEIENQKAIVHILFLSRNALNETLLLTLLDQITTDAKPETFVVIAQLVIESHANFREAAKTDSRNILVSFAEKFFGKRSTFKLFSYEILQYLFVWKALTETYFKMGVYQDHSQLLISYISAMHFSFQVTDQVNLPGKHFPLIFTLSLIKPALETYNKDDFSVWNNLFMQWINLINITFDKDKSVSAAILYTLFERHPFLEEFKDFIEEFKQLCPREDWVSKRKAHRVLQKHNQYMQDFVHPALEKLLD